jgi:hypothetical protein
MRHRLNPSRTFRHVEDECCPLCMQQHGAGNETPHNQFDLQGALNFTRRSAS